MYSNYTWQEIRSSHAASQIWTQSTILCFINICYSILFLKQMFTFLSWGLGHNLFFFCALAYRPQQPTLSPNDSPAHTLQPSDIPTYERSNPVIFRNDRLLPRKSYGFTNNRFMIVGAGRAIDIALLLHAPLGPGQERTFLGRSVGSGLKYWVGL